MRVSRVRSDSGIGREVGVGRSRALILRTRRLPRDIQRKGLLIAADSVSPDERTNPDLSGDADHPATRTTEARMKKLNLGECRVETFATTALTTPAMASIPWTEQQYCTIGNPPFDRLDHATRTACPQCCV